MFRQSTIRPTLEVLEGRLCMSAADPLAAVNDPLDNGHGTHVAGTFAAIGNNRVGQADSGVSYVERMNYQQLSESAPIDGAAAVGGWGSSVYQYAYNDPTPAQVDYFLKLQGIDGDATDAAADGNRNEYKYVAVRRL
ncbi:MAG: hypothetical protein L0Y71_08605 [Gemmataceae bacterium]|nr:hypothetical protein [Gemmataceae bacterium]